MNLSRGTFLAFAQVSAAPLSEIMPRVRETRVGVDPLAEMEPKHGEATSVGGSRSYRRRQRSPKRATKAANGWFRRYVKAP